MAEEIPVGLTRDLTPEDVEACRVYWVGATIKRQLKLETRLITLQS